jgi:hypothetical protein
VISDVGSIPTSSTNKIYGAAKVSTGSKNYGFMPGLMLTVTRIKPQVQILWNCQWLPNNSHAPAGSGEQNPGKF